MGEGAQASTEVTDRFGATRAERELVKRAVAATRAFAQQTHLPVSVLLTDDAEIAQLHGEHLGDPTPTDVISFDAQGEHAVEIVVSVECAERRARELGGERASELTLYVVHGVLHACGFDDIDADDRARMRIAERAVLDQLGVRVSRVD